MRLASYLESSQSRKAADKVIKRGRKMGFLLYVAGIVYMFLLPHENFNLRSYFDENALMAGLVRREYSDLSSLAQYSKVLSERVRDMDVYLDNVVDQFSQLGLEVYSQNFSATRPVVVGSESAHIQGRNVYGIYRAKRAPTTEAIILSAPYQPKMKGNAYGAATMLALAKYFKDKPYWAKDLIFLVTSHEEIGMQAWVDQYMGVVPGRGKFAPVHGELPGRSGSIQAAIHLELPSADISHVNVLIEGQNGALPNLDMVNVVVYLCQVENIRPSFHSTWEWVDPLPLLDHTYLASLLNVASMGGYQSPGLPFGPHSQFIKHRIDSVTVRGVSDVYRDPSSSRSYVDLRNMARALEGTFRSVNNLLETLHHSEFFYFTSAIWRFVTIGRFMPLMVLLLLPLVLEALSQWLQARSSKIKAGHPPSIPAFPFGVLVRELGWSYGSGLVTFCCPLVVCHYWAPATPYLILLSLAVPMTISILFPPLLFCVFGGSSAMVGSDWRIGKFFCLIMCLVTLMPLSMLNFSLAIITAFLLTYPAVLATPYQKKKSRFLHCLYQLLFLLLSPPAIALLCSLFFLFALSPSWGKGLDHLSRGVAFSFNSWQLLNCWGFPFLCVGVWPLWLMSWSLMCQTEAPPKSKSSSTVGKDHQD